MREGGGDARCKYLKFFSFSASSSEEDFVESGRTCCIHTLLLVFHSQLIERDNHTMVEEEEEVEDDGDE